MRQVYWEVASGSTLVGKRGTWDWTEGEVELQWVTTAVSDNPIGSSELPWPFRVIPNWSKQVRPWSLQTDKSLDMGHSKEGAMTLGKVTFFNRREYLEDLLNYYLLPKHSWGIGTSVLKVRGGCEWPSTVSTTYIQTHTHNTHVAYTACMTNTVLQTTAI